MVAPLSNDPIDQSLKYDILRQKAHDGLLIAELDGYAIKGIRVVEGNWLARVVQVIKCKLTPGKHYAVGKHAIAGVVSHYMEKMAQNYAKIYEDQANKESLKDSNDFKCIDDLSCAHLIRHADQLKSIFKAKDQIHVANQAQILTVVFNDAKNLQSIHQQLNWLKGKPMEDQDFVRRAMLILRSLEGKSDSLGIWKEIDRIGLFGKLRKIYLSGKNKSMFLENKTLPKICDFVTYGPQVVQARSAAQALFKSKREDLLTQLGKGLEFYLAVAKIPKQGQHVFNTTYCALKNQSDSFLDKIVVKMEGYKFENLKPTLANHNTLRDAHSRLRVVFNKIPVDDSMLRPLYDAVRNKVTEIENQLLELQKEILSNQKGKHSDELDEFEKAVETCEVELQRLTGMKTVAQEEASGALSGGNVLLDLFDPTRPLLAQKLPEGMGAKDREFITMIKGLLPYHSGKNPGKEVGKPEYLFGHKRQMEELQRRCMDKVKVIEQSLAKRMAPKQEIAARTQQALWDDLAKGLGLILESREKYYENIKAAQSSVDISSQIEKQKGMIENLTRLRDSERSLMKDIEEKLKETESGLTTIDEDFVKRAGIRIF